MNPVTSPHVVHLAASLSKRGYGVFSFINEMTGYLGNEKVTNEIVGHWDPDFVRDQWQHLEKIKVFRGVGIPGSLIYNPKLTNYVSKLDPRKTILHLHGLWDIALHIACLQFMKRGGRCIISPHGMMEPWSLSRSKWKKILVWKTLVSDCVAKAYCLMTTSDQEKNNLRKAGYCGSIATIPIGINVNEYGKNATHKESSEFLGEFKKKRKLIFLSRVDPKKGLPLLFEAISKNGEFLRNWVLLIAGPSDNAYKKELLIIAEDCQIDKYIHWLGEVRGAKKIELLNSAHCFVLPTHSENFGIVVAESLASGVPVITTKNAPWQLLEENKCGWWVDSSVYALGEALDEAFNLPEQELKEMGHIGQTIMREKFSWERISKDTIETYLWVAGIKGPPPCIDPAKGKKPMKLIYPV